MTDESGEYKFTWLPKFTATVERIPEDHRLEFVWAMVLFGTRGVEPDLEWPYDAIFESIRDDITYSHRARRSGASGGRGNRKEPEKAKAKGASKQNETTLKDPFEAPFANASSEPEAKQANIKEKDKKKNGAARAAPPPGAAGGAQAPCPRPTSVEAILDRDRAVLERFRRLEREGAAISGFRRAGEEGGADGGVT